MGQGLGREKEGRVEPVPIQLLPVGMFENIACDLKPANFKT